VAGVEDLVQRIRDGRTGRELGGRTIRRSGDAVCYLHRARGDEDESCLEGGGGVNSQSNMKLTKFKQLKLQGRICLASGRICLG
jgi:hypothetical protein